MFIGDKEVCFAQKENDLINKKINEFVELMFESVSYYTRMRNVNKDRAMVDMFTGKKAEFFAAKLLNEMYAFGNATPDLTVYSGRQKSWTPDLVYSEGRNVHVKCCTASTLKWCGDYSWTFQHSNNTGKHGTDDIFSNPNGDLLSLVYLEEPRSACGIIKGIIPIKDIKDLLKDPKKKTLIGLKKCLYYQDLAA